MFRLFGRGGTSLFPPFPFYLPSLHTSTPIRPLSLMASETLTAYERGRLENIKRNDEMMTSLMIQRKSTDLSSSLKRSLHSLTKPIKTSPDDEIKKRKCTRRFPLVVIRRSPRTCGIPPDPSEHPKSDSPTPSRPSPIPPRKPGPLRIHDAFVGDSPSLSRQFVDTVVSALDQKPSDFIKKAGVGAGLFDPRSSLVLRPENVKRIALERVLSMRFLPVVDRSVIAVGGQLGHVGFWDVDGDGVYLYCPHSGPVSGISVQPFSSSKIFTSSNDGFVRVMDAQKETFDMIYSSDYPISSLCQWPQDINSLYIGEGPGELKVWDERVGKASSSWILHEERINTIDFNPENTNLMATSSTDGMACIWDLRSMNKDRPESIKKVQHTRAVHSAYFSPSGGYLATTSADDHVGILRFDDLSMIQHNKYTGRSSFRAIWGWDDSYLFLGNIKRAVDVISITNKMMTVLKSPLMTAIPCRFSAHPYKIGYLACAAGGKVYLWTTV